MDNIKLKYWSHTCGDGCCYTQGVDIYVNGKKIKPAPEHDGNDILDTVIAILNHYNIDAEVDFEYEDEEECDENQLDLFGGANE